ncbi:MAG: hypothetical protein WCJ84_01015 [Candidatus Peregrinibacteria bacterium]
MAIVSPPQKVRISALLPRVLVREARDASQRENIALGVFLEKILQDWLTHKLQKEAEELSQMHFSDLPTENEWLSLSPRI